MADTNAPLSLLPAHIEETIRSIARLHAEHTRMLRRFSASSIAQRPYWAAPDPLAC
jgi:hypothetical protein